MNAILPVPTTGRITLVVSRGQSRHPDKRGLEQALVDAADQMRGVNVLIVPHLYDLPKTSEAFKHLRAIEGDMVVASWIFRRAAHWVLDRHGVQGQVGEVELGEADDEDLEDNPLDNTSADDSDDEAVDRVTDIHPRPKREIYCLDFKNSTNADDFIAEIERIIAPEKAPESLPIVSAEVQTVDENTKRRWYPVIDFNRCTNCMECIDFCLFGVYGVDGVENILVEQPDNCRKGCPACSRVCPANAIIFPQHKAPAIAGAEVDGDEGFKIDLSQLFGKPAESGDAITTAARERDEQLLLAGRDAIGIDDQLSRRQDELSQKPKDDLDELLDELDEFDAVTAL
ncbi:MAG: ferredoxin family protein [Planctomycetota bacterium]